MNNALKAFWQKTPTKIGIATAILFQLIFSIIWMTGYKGVEENSSNLKVAIVNEDSGLGEQIALQSQSNLPFQVFIEASLEEAQRQLNNREIQLVIHVPADFTERLQTLDQKGELQYWLNESNPILIKNIMSIVSTSVTATVNKQAITAGAQVMLKQMNVLDVQAFSTAEALSERVTATLHQTNPVHGMNNQMVPMMLVLASFVGSMIMGMNLQQASVMIGTQVGRWSKFTARAVLNVITAVITALVGSSLVLLLGGQSAYGFMTLWGFETLCLLAFLFFSQLFLLLFGNAGMVLNIIMLSAQLVSSGALVPRELLSDFYYRLSLYLPATYAVEGNMNLLFGGPELGRPAGMLIIFIGCSVAIGLIITGLQRDKTAVPSVTPKLANS